MPFDTTDAIASANAPTVAPAAPAAPAVLNGVDLGPVIDSLEPRRAHAARVALALGYLHEDLLAALGNVELATVRDWRVNRTGPASAKLGQSILYPVAELTMVLERAVLGTHAPARSRRR